MDNEDLDALSTHIAHAQSLHIPLSRIESAVNTLSTLTRRRDLGECVRLAIEERDVVKLNECLGECDGVGVDVGVVEVGWGVIRTHAKTNALAKLLEDINDPHHKVYLER